MRKKQDYLRALITFLLSAFFLIGAYVLVEWRFAGELREQYQYMAANQVNIIKNGVDTALSRTYTLKAMVRENKGDVSFFDSEAKLIYDETVEQTGLRLKNMALAPGCVVEKVYPLEGNEGFIGFDYRDEAMAGNAEAMQAYYKGDMIVTNPFELVQGGVGMGARLPVFLSQGGDSQFWGLVTVTIDYNELLRQFALDSLTKMGAGYRLWYMDDSGREVDLASSGKLPKSVESCEFLIKNLTWQLDIAPQSGWYDAGQSIVGSCMALAIALLMAMLSLNKAQIKSANEQLQKLAHQDGLTGCNSRHFVNSVLVNQRNGQWNDSNARYSLAVIDIDDFKSVNDVYGHDTGDRALLAIAQVLRDNISEENGDCVIRHGGDEFVVLLNGISAKNLSKKLQTIVTDINKIHFPDYPDIKLTVSVGAECCAELTGSLYYDMMRHADKKMYQAKQNGKNQFLL